MSETIKAFGACLCGACEFSAATASTHMGSCHCKTCRRWGGGPYMSVHCGKDVNFKDTSSIQTFNSSKWAERGFCKTCGTHLFYHLKGSDQYMLPAGLFDDKFQFNFTRQVFIDEKPDYYTFENDTKKMTGPQVMAAFAS